MPRIAMWRNRDGLKEEAKQETGDKDDRTLCLICCNFKRKARFHRLTEQCDHVAGCCSRCIKSHIEAEINSKGDFSVTCPECKKELDHAAVKAYAADRDFQKYDTLLLRRVLRSLPDFRWCKNSTCGSGQEHSSGHAAPVLRCHACNKRSCFTHDVPWHEGLTCGDYDDMLARDHDEIANEDYKRRMTKPCPKCETAIEKSTGCDHMTCMKRAGGCGHEFCWCCLADYEPILRDGNHHHKSTCTYWFDFVPDVEADVEFEDQDEYDED